LPPGCHFAPRCPHRMERCVEGEIPLYDLADEVQVRCVLFDPVAGQRASTDYADYADYAD
jgi:hypothetical protein